MLFNQHKKLQLYNILNGVKLEYLKNKEPFNIMDADIKLTYNVINMKFIKGKNYFVIVPKKTNNKSDGNFKKPNSKPYEHKFTPEENAAYLERKKRRESHGDSRSQSPVGHKFEHKFTPEENAAYLERKKRRESHGDSRSQSPIGHKFENKFENKFTPEETAAYLERKKKRNLSINKNGYSDIKPIVQDTTIGGVCKSNKINPIHTYIFYNIF